ncbi:MAG TPA: hypothetical protein VGK88_09775 [bacterium]|jgi:hypothetical protein
MKILLAVVVFAIVAQFPSCGNFGIQQGDIVGFVDDKYIAAIDGPALPYIVIGATEYEVPWYFYRLVSINDLVKFSHGTWTILKKAAR